MRIQIVIPALVTIVLLTVLDMAAQATGYWQLDKVQMVSQTQGWALAPTSRGSVLLKTSDGGRDWRNVSPKGIWPLSPEQVQHNEDVGPEGIDTYFLDGQTGWVAMENWGAIKDQPAQVTQGQVIVERTRDGGRHWVETQFSENTGFFLRLSFLDTRHGSILAISDMASGSTGKALYRTSDGGRTWSIVTKTLPDHIDPTGVSFRNASEGWLTAGYHGSDEAPFYRTDDGGRHWRLQELDVSPLYQEGYVLTYPPAFFGVGRREGVLPIRFVTHAPEREGFALYRTQDNGHIWRFLRRLPQTAWLENESAMHFNNLQTGWALDESALRLTQDGGKHWRVVYPIRRLSH